MNSSSLMNFDQIPKSWNYYTVGVSTESRLALLSSIQIPACTSGNLERHSKPLSTWLWRASVHLVLAHIVIVRICNQIRLTGELLRPFVDSKARHEKDGSNINLHGIRVQLAHSLWQKPSSSTKQKTQIDESSSRTLTRRDHQVVRPQHGQTGIVHFIRSTNHETEQLMSRFHFWWCNELCMWSHTKLKICEHDYHAACEPICRTRASWFPAGRTNNQSTLLNQQGYTCLGRFW